MSDDDAFDQRLLKSAEAYARLYPSVTRRLKQAYDAGHPLTRQVAKALGVAIARAETHREEHLKAAHKLSPQEVRVVLHLVDGGAVATCAEALGVAESTVRTHLKSIFAKTGVRRQAELRTLLPS